MGWWRLLKRNLRVAGGLSAADWLILAEAWWMLLGFRLALGWAPFERLQGTNDRRLKKDVPPACDLQAARRLQRLVYLASRLHLIPMTCLVQALVLYHMLNRRGIFAVLRLGVNQAAKGMQAHAWVEVEGQPLDETERPAERFKVLSGG